MTPNKDDQLQERDNYDTMKQMKPTELEQINQELSGEYQTEEMLKKEPAEPIKIEVHLAEVEGEIPDLDFYPITFDPNNLASSKKIMEVTIERLYNLAEEILMMKEDLSDREVKAFFENIKKKLIVPIEVPELLEPKQLSSSRISSRIKRIEDVIFVVPSGVLGGMKTRRVPIFPEEQVGTGFQQMSTRHKIATILYHAATVLENEMLSPS